MLLWMILLIVLLVILISWISLKRDCNTFKNVSGPTPLPLLGNCLMFLGDSTQLLKTLDKLKTTYGNACRVHLFSSRYVVLSHPKYIEPLLSSTELITKGKSYDFVKSWLGNGLLTATGLRWKTHRKFLTPAFHFNILQNFPPVFCKNGRILREKLVSLADGTSIDLFPIIALAALDNVTECLMGVSFNAQRNVKSEYVKAVHVLSEIISLRIRNPFVAEEAIFKLLPLKTKQDKALSIQHGQTKKVIEKRRQELTRANITELATESGMGIRNKHAFLDLLLLSKIDGEKIDDESVREEVDTFMFEGHDTTTSGIVFTLFCISKYEEVQEKILQEQKNIFGDDWNRDPTFNELHEMKYLELVIKESLRLYPSVPLIERKIKDETDIAELHIPKNTSVIVNFIHMQRSPEMYEDPLMFRPERFEDMSSRNPFTWLPFSAGPRNCIGQKFAMMEMKVTISEIVRHLRLLPSGIEPELCADLILRSRNGVYVGCKPRP